MDQKIFELQSGMQHAATLLEGIQPQELKTLNEIIAGLIKNDLGIMIQGIEQNAQELKGLHQQFTAQQRITGQIQQEMIRIGNGTGTEKETKGFTSSKLIPDYKCWDDIHKLDENRSGFRDWKFRFKRAYRQTTKIKN